MKRALLLLFFITSLSSLSLAQEVFVGNSLVFPKDTYGYVENEDYVYDDNGSAKPSEGFKQRCLDSAVDLAQRAGLEDLDILKTKHTVLEQSSISPEDDINPNSVRALFGCSVRVSDPLPSHLEVVYMGKKGWRKAQRLAQKLYQNQGVIAVVIQRRQAMNVTDLFLREKIYVVRLKK